MQVPRCLPWSLVAAWLSGPSAALGYIGLTVSPSDVITCTSLTPCCFSRFIYFIIQAFLPKLCPLWCLCGRLPGPWPCVLAHEWHLSCTWKKHVYSCFPSVVRNVLSLTAFRQHRAGKIRGKGAWIPRELLCLLSRGGLRVFSLSFWYFLTVSLGKQPLTHCVGPPESRQSSFRNLETSVSAVSTNRLWALSIPACRLLH